MRRPRVAQVDTAYVFDKVDVGLGTIHNLHCLLSTEQHTGLSKINNTGIAGGAEPMCCPALMPPCPASRSSPPCCALSVYHELAELVQLARQQLGLLPSPHPLSKRKTDIRHYWCLRMAWRARRGSGKHKLPL